MRRSPAPEIDPCLGGLFDSPPGVDSIADWLRVDPMCAFPLVGFAGMSVGEMLSPRFVLEELGFGADVWSIRRHLDPRGRTEEFVQFAALVAVRRQRISATLDIVGPAAFDEETPALWKAAARRAYDVIVQDVVDDPVPPAERFARDPRAPWTCPFEPHATFVVSPERLPLALGAFEAYGEEFMQVVHEEFRAAGFSVSPAQAANLDAVQRRPEILALECVRRFGNWRIDHLVACVRDVERPSIWIRAEGIFDLQRIREGLARYRTESASTMTGVEDVFVLSGARVVIVPGVGDDQAKVLRGERVDLLRPEVWMRGT